MSEQRLTVEKMSRAYYGPLTIPKEEKDQLLAVFLKNKKQQISAAVVEYLSTDIGGREICKKYGIKENSLYVAVCRIRRRVIAQQKIEALESR